MSVALYRHYAADGTLLYVGVSANPFRRLSEHNFRSGRRPVRIDIEWFENRTDALAAERACIKADKPRDNIAAPRPASGKTPANAETAELIRLIEETARRLSV